MYSSVRSVFRYPTNSQRIDVSFNFLYLKQMLALPLPVTTFIESVWNIYIVIPVGFLIWRKRVDACQWESESKPICRAPWYERDLTLIFQLSELCTEVYLGGSPASFFVLTTFSWENSIYDWRDQNHLEKTVAENAFRLSRKDQSLNISQTLSVWQENLPNQCNSGRLMVHNPVKSATD